MTLLTRRCSSMVNFFQCPRCPQLPLVIKLGTVVNQGTALLHNESLWSGRGETVKGRD